MVRPLYILAFACWGLWGIATVQAQKLPVSALTRGVAAVEAERPAQAIARLDTLFQRAPAYRTAGEGSVAYWLGRAYRADGQPDRALAVWQRGLEAIERAGAFDVRLADAFIRAVFTQRSGRQYVPATAAYQVLVQRADSTLAPPERALLADHLEALAIVLPDTVQEQTGLRLRPVDEEPERPLLARLHPNAVKQLLAWWRGQDPVPATAANERLEQHLERAIYARKHYEWEGRLDDRGKIYVRLGPPYKQTDVEFNTPRFRRKVLYSNPTFAVLNFSDSVFWIYPHIGHAAHFLFVEHENGRYLLGTPEDLLPSTLNMGFTPSARGRRKGEAYVRTMVLVYRQLALYHPAYSFLYQKTANYASMLDMQEFTGRALPSSQLPPASFAQSVLSESRTREWQMERRRREVLPHTYVDPPRHAAPFVAENVRLARFLEDDGTTRTEIYWSLSTDALAPSRQRLSRLGLERDDLAGRYLLSIVLSQKAAGHRIRHVQRKRRLIENASAGAVLMPQTLVARGDTGRYHLALQWDAYLAYDRPRPDAPPRLGPHLKTDTYRVDSLHALSSNEYRLAMSDLKPLIASGGPAALPDAPPYPFRRISPKTALALYFEIYHLAYGADDHTHYTVEYEVFRRTKQGFLERIFMGDDTQRTSTQTTASGEARKAEEYILLDLSEHAEAGRLEVTVRVTDETTGQQAARTIAFEVVTPLAEARE